MRRVFLAMALATFLAQVAAWPVAGLPSAHAWPAACLLIGALVGTFLLETRGPAGARAAAGLGLAFGLLFPALATRLGGTYGFGPTAWLPGVPLAWVAFLLLALALYDQARWFAASSLERRCGPWVAGLTLGAMETLWDPALLAEGALWSRAPSAAGWPHGFTPGFPILHMLVGWGFARLLDRMNATGRLGWKQVASAAAALVAVALAPVLLGAWLALPAIPGPRPLPLLAEVVAASLTCLACARALELLLPRLLPRQGGAVLLTTCPGPVRPYAGGHYPLDFYSSRSSRGQGPWTSEVECPYLGAHLIASNLETATVVLEYPTLEQLAEELEEVPFQVVGVGFTVVSREGVRRVCELVRRIRPEATIVLGGYGVVCLPPTQEGDLSFDGLVDEVCVGEGVAFMRRLLGEPEDASVALALPHQRMFPLGLRLASQAMMVLIAGFGCDKRCGFCGTSAFFEGRNLRLGSSEELAITIEGAVAADPSLEVVAMFDEDFLADRARLQGLAARLREGQRVDSTRIQLSVFGTLASLAQYSPEELAELGVGFVWVGVESKFTNLKKVGDDDAGARLRALEEHGIGTTVSWILGFDQQTPENLSEDLDWLVSLPSVTAQISLLGPIPGTPLYRQLEARGRLIPRDWEQHHLYEECMEYTHFGPGELRSWVDRAYEALYRHRGPSLLRAAEVWWRGYQSHRDHASASLRRRAAHELRRLREIAPVLVALALAGEHSGHRARARRLLYEISLGGVRGLGLGLGLTALVMAHGVFLRVFGLPARQPRAIRTRYPGGEPR